MPDFLPTLAALAVSAFTSATILPGTSEVLLLALIAVQAAPLWLLLVVASAANVAGSSVNWVIGRWAGRLGAMRRLSSDGRMAQAERWFQRWGKWSLLASWVPIIGDPLTLAAGLLHVRYPVFVVLVTIAKTARYVVIALVARQI